MHVLLYNNSMKNNLLISDRDKVTEISLQEQKPFIHVYRVYKFTQHTFIMNNPSDNVTRFCNPATYYVHGGASTEIPTYMETISRHFCMQK